MEAKHKVYDYLSGLIFVSSLLVLSNAGGSGQPTSTPAPVPVETMIRREVGRQMQTIECCDKVKEEVIENIKEYIDQVVKEKVDEEIEAIKKGK